MATAREGLLDSFEEILIDEGERSATLDAVATRAQVSKGGLLYHFASKAALVDGLISRLQTRADVDVEEMTQAPEGPTAHYVRTSAEVDTAFDQTFMAVYRLSVGRNSQAVDAIQEMRARWLRVIVDEVKDHDVALAILLMGDGLYYNASLTGDSATGDAPAADAQTAEPLLDVDALLRVVTHLRASIR